MGRRGILRRGRGPLLIAVAGAVVLAACTPKAPAPPPPPPAPPAPAAQLSISPTTATLSTESVYDVGDTGHFTVTNVGNAPSGAVAVDVGDLQNEAELDWTVSNDQCSGQSLAPQQTCTLDLEPHGVVYWGAYELPHDLTVTATPGGSASAAVEAHLTSDIWLQSSITPMIVYAGQTPLGQGIGRYVVQNNGSTPIGPLTWEFDADPNGVGTMTATTQLGWTPCSQGMTLAPGDDCSWAIDYANSTGSGSNVMIVSATAPDGASFASLVFGEGVPAVCNDQPC